MFWKWFERYLWLLSDRGEFQWVTFQVKRCSASPDPTNWWEPRWAILLIQQARFHLSSSSPTYLIRIQYTITTQEAFTSSSGKNTTKINLALTRTRHRSAEMRRSLSLHFLNFRSFWTDKQEKPTNCGTKAADVLDKFFSLLTLIRIHPIFLLS